MAGLQQDQFSNEAKINMTDRGFDIHSGTHGTAYREGMGDVIRPGGEVGLNNFTEFSRSNRTYYTANSSPERNAAGHDLNLMDRQIDYIKETGQIDRNKANFPKDAENNGWHWAGLANADDKHAITGDPVKPRAVVHDVKPLGHIDEDPVLNRRGTTSNELTADALQITDTKWIPPHTWSSQEDEVAQGTLPNYNWNKQAPLESDGSIDKFEDHNVKRSSPRLERQTRLSEEARNTNAQQFNEKAKQRETLFRMGQQQIPGLEG